ncbi:MAG: hypothetical protein JO370_16590 [Paucibacter sp.]|nr:hypothetical protein [Roseateles sp.]
MLGFHCSQKAGTENRQSGVFNAIPGNRWKIIHSLSTRLPATRNFTVAPTQHQAHSLAHLPKLLHELQANRLNPAKILAEIRCNPVRKNFGQMSSGRPKLSESRTLFSTSRKDPPGHSEVQSGQRLNVPAA